ncbi:MAG: LLM class flavin-dependent oxidoreductase [Pseudomonadota bacterium]
MIPFSILDLCPVIEGATPRNAFDNACDLAQHAEALGFNRYWLAEHHNMPGIASAATAVVIGHVAAATNNIRIGAGGIMLPNHSPLVIAEQFGTLASLYPGRIDLGLGRAPGTDGITARAMRKDIVGASERFPQDVQELLAYFEPAIAGQRVQAVPGSNLDVPVWILGSSLFGAQLAAALGLPYAFASHFAPDELHHALMVYRQRFKPSKFLQKPYVMVGCNVFAADTDAEARHLFTSLQWQFVNLFRGAPGKLHAPFDDLASRVTPAELAGVERALVYSFVGGKDTVRRQLLQFVAETQADEVMIGGQIHDHQARKYSYQIAAEIREEAAKAVA